MQEDVGAVYTLNPVKATESSHCSIGLLGPFEDSYAADIGNSPESILRSSFAATMAVL